MRPASAVLLLALAAAPAAHAQLGIPGMGGRGGMGLPSLGGASTGNVAGLLGYCVKNKLLGGTGQGMAGGVLGQLTGQPQVTESPDYKAGLAGTLLGGGAPAPAAKPAVPGGVGGALGGLAGGGGSQAGGFSMESLTGGLKSQMCDAVLKQARTLL